MLFRKVMFVCVVVVTINSTPGTAQDDLDVISKWLKFTDAPNSLYHHLAEEAYSHLEKRSEAVSSINTLDGWKERQQLIRSNLLNMAGPFPEKTPLNAKVIRTIEKETYRVEHVVFESQPKFFVTGSLFIPESLKKREKAPAVIYCSGHSAQAYRSQVYQHVILNLVNKGFIVFAFDPVGQGERLEYLDPQTGKSERGGPTAEHSYPGAQAFITGSSLARYMIWDGIRAVDYLLTRKEVDPARLGITGRSGGGTQSSYIAAFDERIKAAAPECYITSFTRLLQSIGPQDAEQNFFHGIAEGFDHGDLLLVRAPKPALMITTTRDMFSIQGARETFREVSRIYDAYGETANFGMVEDDAPHASTEKNREALYAFFQKHLDLPGSAKDEPVTVLSADEIQVTSTGQVSTALGGETIFSLNRREAQERMKLLGAARAESAHIENTIATAKKLSGYVTPRTQSSPVFTGRIQREGYAIEKYFLKGEGDYIIPYLLMVPEQSNGKSILYLHPSGKKTEASPGGEIETFLTQGFTVLAPDLPGSGELGSGDFHGDAYIDGVSHNIWYGSILIGRSIVGVQAADVGRLVHTLKNHHQANAVYAIARKELTPLLLHAAAFLPEIQRIALIDPLHSYGDITMNRHYHSGFIPGAVAGALTGYDLPDLAASLAPRKLLIATTTSDFKANGKNEHHVFTERIYAERKAQGQLKITDVQDLENTLTRWCME